MNKVKIILLSGLCIFISESCQRDNDCALLYCNNGILNELTCNCNCPEGYVGNNCEKFDATKVQELLNSGQTPKTLYDGEVPIDSIYGKEYNGGLIYYYSTDDGTGMIAAKEDQTTVGGWGCLGVDVLALENIMNSPINFETEQGARIGDGKPNTDAILAECSMNGIAAELCRDLGEDWFLPSLGELNLMYTNLHEKGKGEFSGGAYWSSTEFDADNSWGLFFLFGNLTSGSKTNYKNVRASRVF